MGHLLWPLGQPRSRWTGLDYPKAKEFHRTEITALNIRTLMMTTTMMMITIIHKNSSNYSYVTAAVDVA
jgi:hypothetical protein